MKKFLSVMLLVFGIIFGNQFLAIEKVSAADVYAYSEGGVEYYVTGSRTLNPFVGAFGASVKGVSGGKVIKYLYFVCNPAPSNGKWVYQIQDQTGGMRSSHVVEEGYLSNSGKAQAVYNIVKSGKLEEANQKELAEKQNKSINQNSNSKQSLLDKAKSYRDKKDFNSAVEMYNQALKIDPNDKWAYFMLGRTYREMGNPQSAIETFSKIIQMDSNFHAAYAWRGLAYKDIKNYTNMLVDYNEWIRLLPNDSWAYIERGDYYRSIKDYNHAIEDYTKVTTIQDEKTWTRPRAYYWRGWIYEQTKKYKNALDDYNKALEFNPNDNNAKQGRQRVLEKVK